MPKPPNKRVNDPDSPIQQPAPSRTRKKPPPLPGAVCRTVSRLAEEFREKHGLQDHRTAVSGASEPYSRRRT